MKNTQVYLSLGGNEGEVLPRLQLAVNLLSHQQGVKHMKVSHFYRTSPIHVNSPHWFVNAACAFQTSLSPAEIFTITQSIEMRLGKRPKPKDAPRPIDIDLLFYGTQNYLENDLEIPHPRWKERLFVLMPLADLTHAVTFQGKAEEECYLLQDLIRPLLNQSGQAIYLLEKNPDLQYDMLS